MVYIFDFSKLVIDYTLVGRYGLFLFVSGNLHFVLATV